MRTSILFILLVIWQIGHTQQTGLSPIVRKLAESKGTINILNPTSCINLPDIPAPFSANKVHLVKTPGALLAMVDFTGMIFQLSENADNGLQWKRIDSTYFSGYNMNNLLFYANNRVYSFGGGGLWQITGHLRYYQPDKFEWDLMPLNREIPHLSDPYDAFWLDEKNKQFYLLGKRFPTPTLKQNDDIYKEIEGKCWRLDLVSGNWTSLGASPDTTFLVVANSPWGLLYFHNNVPCIVDFINNRYLQGKTGTVELASRYFRQKAKSLVFFKDSTLWFGDSINYIDSIKFSAADFVDTGIPLYDNGSITVKSSTNKFLMAGALVFALLGAGYFLWGRFQPKGKHKISRVEQSLPQTPTQPVIQNLKSSQENHPLSHVLEERELLLLSELHYNSNLGHTTSIDEINKILGLQAKNIEIQKRHRSDNINSINQKLAKWLKTDQLVIDKIRSENDKRSFEYFIRPEFIEELNYKYK